MPNTQTTPIERAIARGEYEKFAELFPAVTDIDAIATFRGDTLLGRACTQTSGQKFTEGHRRIIETLLEHGADPHRPGRIGLTALGLAAWHGDYESVDVLFEAGVEVEAWTEIVALALENRFRGRIAESPDLAWAVCNDSGWEERAPWTPLDLLSTSRMWRCDLQLAKSRGRYKEIAVRVTGAAAPELGSRMAAMARAILDVEPPRGFDLQSCLDFGLRCASSWGSREVAAVLSEAGASS